MSGESLMMVGRTLGAAAPIDDLGLVDLEASVISRGQARHVANCAIHVDHPPAGTTDQVVVVVADAILVARRRPRRLDPAEQPTFRERGEHVIDRLAGDRPELRPHDGTDLIGGAVRVLRHGAQHGDALGRHGHP